MPNHTILYSLFLVAAALAPPLTASADTTPTPLVAVPFASGFNLPVFATSPPGDKRRLFVVEQVTGRIRVVRDGQLIDTPFLDIGSRVNNGGGERGLLGLAFHPNYASNGFFYVNYIANGSPGDTVVARYSVTANPDIADPASESLVLTIAQPFTNHNGGMLAFGPVDHYLYIGTGDGGSADDPLNSGQSLATLLGKILRVDVDVAPYGIPSDNPFVGSSAARPEIWAFGLRNPWRFGFDRQTADLYIGDVGQGAREEVDFQPAASPGGENYGWRTAEGFACRGGRGTCGTNPGFSPPVFDYNHTVGNSITGGYVYRGMAIPDLRGTYFFGDFVKKRVWSFRPNGAGIEQFTDRTAELFLSPAEIGGVSSFGEDARGELYVLDYANGIVYRIAAATLVADVNADGAVNAVDVQATINTVLGLNGNVTDADIDNDGVVDAVDIQCAVNAVLGT